MTSRSHQFSRAGSPPCFPRVSWEARPSTFPLYFLPYRRQKLPGLRRHQGPARSGSQNPEHLYGNYAEREGGGFNASVFIEHIKAAADEQQPALYYIRGNKDGTIRGANVLSLKEVHPFGSSALNKAELRLALCLKAADASV